MTAASVDLDPSAVGAGTYATRQRRHLLDVSFLLSITFVLAAVLPAGLTFPQLSDLGRPTTVAGLGLAMVWVLSRLHHRLATRGPQPLRWAVTILLTSILMSYVAGLLRAMPSIESNGADRAVLAAIAFFGPVLAFADGVPNRQRLDAVLQTLVLAGGFMAVIGIIQSVFNFDPTIYIRVPGLITLGDYDLPEYRGAGFARVSSTAEHYIEFSAVMAMLIPFGVQLTLFGATRAIKQWAGVCTALMFCVIPMTLSRTGVVALGTALIVLVLVWPIRMAYNLLLPLVGLTAMLSIVRPHLLGSVISLFTNWNNDPSVQGREDDYAIVGHYFSQRPWFGRGHGTFIPGLYAFLDNQWLGDIVSGGIVGTAARAGLHLTAIVLSILAYRRATTLADRHLCACLGTTQVVAMVVAGTFDSFSFTTLTTVLAILTGASGAMWRLLHTSRQVRTAGPGHAE